MAAIDGKKGKYILVISLAKSESARGLVSASWRGGWGYLLLI